MRGLADVAQHLYTSADGFCSPHVAAPDRGAEAERTVIGQCDQSIVALCRHDDSDRPEDLFLPDPHLARDPDQHRRRVELADRAVGQERTASEHLRMMPTGLSAQVSLPHCEFRMTFSRDAAYGQPYAAQHGCRPGTVGLRCPPTMTLPMALGWIDSCF